MNNSIDLIHDLNETQRDLIKEFKDVLLKQEGVFKDYKELSSKLFAINEYCLSICSLIHIIKDSKKGKTNENS